ncbi:MAG: phosphopantothenoylcysteine decarboxylase/phosphopantothenate-cysteine ligase, phosphopantothenoylcysteine decarboxylase / phosphopantothenate-cysteine ligase [Candidatus Peregrinibacteria bacterium GW2011_GWF2_33_10]|nr:MAG: phosphopantothenoylcysteine decarboxylase/phosphopantothenate-cysteine ligase, phosphopantothenoylcysteine decarboxylase / phosphopantothenate-cysteine ligase [Candidatus Peregrinibacteria bacterium GW2011_GWF2_33_10]OGJ44457.1 MAG: hypothetical protein A2272_01190 [Candidatus Peregrinibacteria bacterium RIFOXYA12_FULL_33_12]OGJ45026.1 MAG: hypothetical protein A2263_03045 [Candidatus Peregrinibacteria bacterium RIFOXYA2_FULL_33_21]OGJ51714.1 MAG: hypothetical protein A2307_05335 [Candid
MNILNNKKILLGISGSIAVKKVSNLIKLLQKTGAEVEVVATKNALGIFGEYFLELEKDLGKKIWSEMSENKVNHSKFVFPHLDLAKWADLILLAPATANLIGKIANGIADDLLSTLIMAFEGQVFIAPAMNSRMWNNFFVQRNVKRLKQLQNENLSSQKFEILGPVEGKLACGEEGIGRMIEVKEIVEKLAHFQPLSYYKRREFLLRNKTVLITAGATREYLDPVRFISNGSSGKMGIALAQKVLEMGGKVIMISGIGNSGWRIENENIEIIDIETTDEMFEAVKKNINKVDIFISSAAVCDFKPEKISKQKLKKDSEQARMTIDFEKTVDILKWVGDFKIQKNSKLKAQSSKLKLIGFALETGNIIANAKKKLKEKHLDLIVANKPSNIGQDTGEFYFITENKMERKIGSKLEIAENLLRFLHF